MDCNGWLQNQGNGEELFESLAQMFFEPLSTHDSDGWPVEDLTDYHAKVVPLARRIRAAVCDYIETNWDADSGLDKTVAQLAAEGRGYRSLDDWKGVKMNKYSKKEFGNWEAGTSGTALELEAFRRMLRIQTPALVDDPTILQPAVRIWNFDYFGWRMCRLDPEQRLRLEDFDILAQPAADSSGAQQAGGANGVM